MTQTTLFDPCTLGEIPLSNRIVMAPLTRNRAAAGLVPGPQAAQYYAQRATAGLIISEASQISRQGQGYQDTPGIYTGAQVAGFSCNCGMWGGFHMWICNRMGPRRSRLRPSRPRERPS